MTHIIHYWVNSPNNIELNKHLPKIVRLSFLITLWNEYRTSFWRDKEKESKHANDASENLLKNLVIIWMVKLHSNSDCKICFKASSYQPKKLKYDILTKTKPPVQQREKLTKMVATFC